MKLYGSIPLKGPVSGDQSTVDSIGSTTVTGPTTRSAFRVARGAARHRLANNSGTFASDDSAHEGREPIDDSPPRTFHSSGIAMTTGMGFRDSNLPMASTCSTRAIGATSGRAPMPTVDSLDNLIDRLIQERNLARELRFNGTLSGWHDSIYIASWQHAFEQHDRFGPAGQAVLLRTLTDAISDIRPTQRACETLWQVIEAVEDLPTQIQAGILQGLGKQMHVATNDVDGKRMFDRLIHCAKKLPDSDQAKVYTALLETSRHLHPTALNHAFISILRATGTLASVAASPCIEALTVTVRALQPAARSDAFSLLCDLVLKHDSDTRHEHLSRLISILNCVDQPADRYNGFSRILAGLKQQASDDSVALIPCLLEGLTALPEGLRMYVLHKIVAVSLVQPARTQAANLPVLQNALAQLEREMCADVAFDTAAQPAAHQGNTFAELVAGLASWAIKDGSHQYFPDTYLPHLYEWTATRPVQDQQVIFGRLIAQIKLDAATLGCGVRLDQDPVRMALDFCTLIETVERLPRAALAQVVDPLLTVVRTAQDNRRPYAPEMMEVLRSRLSVNARLH